MPKTALDPLFDLGEDPPHRTLTQPYPCREEPSLFHPPLGGGAYADNLQQVLTSYYCSFVIHIWTLDIRCSLSTHKVGRGEALWLSSCPESMRPYLV